MISIIGYLFETESAKELAVERLRKAAKEEGFDKSWEHIRRGELPNADSFSRSTVNSALRKAAESDVEKGGSWSDEAQAHGGKVAAVAGLAGIGLLIRKHNKEYEAKQNKKK